MSKPTGWTLKRKSQEPTRWGVPWPWDGTHGFAFRWGKVRIYGGINMKGN